MEKAEWNTAQEECGAQCVTTPGMPMMLVWCATSLDTHLLVCHQHTHTSVQFTTVGLLFIQVLLHCTMPTLVKELDQSLSTQLCAVAMNLTSVTVLSVPRHSVPTPMMLV